MRGKIVRGFVGSIVAAVLLAAFLAVPVGAQQAPSPSFATAKQAFATTIADPMLITRADVPASATQTNPFVAIVDGKQVTTYRFTATGALQSNDCLFGKPGSTSMTYFVVETSIKTADKWQPYGRVIYGTGSVAIAGHSELRMTVEMAQADDAATPTIIVLSDGQQQMTLAGNFGGPYAASGCLK